jgi:hypothetical protein
MNTLYILGCGAQKLDAPAFAVDLYTGPHFRAALGHAQRYAKEPLAIRILSAKHGLLYQREHIEPYNTRLSDLSTNERAALVERVRASASRLPSVLRVVMLAGADYAALWRDACAGTSMEKVPVRAPLQGLGIGYQRQWFANAHSHSAQCRPGPILHLYELTDAENVNLDNAIKTASQWWATQLLRESPPPEPSLFADALALRLKLEWKHAREVTRGEWDEDVRLNICYQNSPGAVLGEAFRLCGLNPNEWWVREWRDRRLVAYMYLSMKKVVVQIGDADKVIFQA